MARPSSHLMKKNVNICVMAWIFTCLMQVCKPIAITATMCFSNFGIESKKKGVSLVGAPFFFGLTFFNGHRASRHNERRSAGGFGGGPTLDGPQKTASLLIVVSCTKKPLPLLTQHNYKRRFAGLWEISSCFVLVRPLTLFSQIMWCRIVWSSVLMCRLFRHV